MTLSVFLTADLHLGMKFAGYPESAQAALVEARFACLERMVEQAGSLGCDLFIVAGDLFDRISAARRDIQRAATALRSFSGKLVAVLPGNHDYLGPGDQLWPAFRSSCGDSVLLLDEPRAYPLVRYDVDACLYAGPCTSKHSRSNAIQWVKGAPKDPAVTHHLGVAHGSLEGFSPDFTESYYPLTTVELLSSGMSAWLIGHTHVPFPAAPGPRDRIFNPGTPEPDGFDCLHTGSAWHLQFSAKDAVTATRVPTGSLRFIEETIAVHGAADLELLLRRYSGHDARSILLRANLAGRVPHDLVSEIGRIRQSLTEGLLYSELRTTRLSEEITREAIDREYPQGSFPHQLLSRLAASGDSEALSVAQDLLEETRG
ncbi:MAG TPA: metallophosphoesterase [Spirochaetia bacterium]|nr:metallophosphoesterase [Spirochaetia bacterium]